MREASAQVSAQDARSQYAIRGLKTRNTRRQCRIPRTVQTHAGKKKKKTNAFQVQAVVQWRVCVLECGGAADLRTWCLSSSMPLTSFSSLAFPLASCTRPPRVARVSTRTAHAICILHTRRYPRCPFSVLCSICATKNKPKNWAQSGQFGKSGGNLGVEVVEHALRVIQVLRMRRNTHTRHAHSSAAEVACAAAIDVAA